MMEFLHSHFSDEDLMMITFYLLMVTIASAIALLYYVEKKLYDHHNDLN